MYHTIYTVLLLPHLINYRYFAQAVFDMHNSLHVVVFNCSFLHNRGTGIIQEPYHGNTGALSITYNNLSLSASNPNITVTSCIVTLLTILHWICLILDRQVRSLVVVFSLEGVEQWLYLYNKIISISPHIFVVVILDIMQLVRMVDTLCFVYWTW